MQFGSKVFKRLKPGRSGGYQQGVDLGGIQILVNYGNTDYQRVSLEDVLSNKVNYTFFKNKVVLIGVIPFHEKPDTNNASKIKSHPAIDLI
ncbi:MAG: CHASE2 domain-containing protein [Heteroscytonema crispum UTEX LB 1556]